MPADVSEYSATTRQVRVSVVPRFAPERSDPRLSKYFFLYTVTITNEGPETVQLISRHWVITDAHGQVEEVRGAGVVGEQPILAPGTGFKYTSGCPLGTPFGSMVGTYQMQTANGDEFEVQIPAFALRNPDLMQ
jgi:ApaG protein